MDTKSLAKSKRAHSQYHSKKHHPKTLKGSSTTSIGAASTSSNGKNRLGNEIKEKPPRQFQGSSAFPSNWDRYEEEFDLAVEDSSSQQDRTNNDVVLPKTKGADYGYLISEAKSQCQTCSSSEIFPSLDDVMNDIGQGMGTYLSVRGQSILSWTEGDSFAVEDKETASNEASFFSLDLHALAEQLAKVDLSKRLFIEADLLPPELFTEELQASHNSSQDQPARGAEMENKDTEEEVPANIISFGSSETRTSNHLAKGFSYDQLKSTEQVEDEPPQVGRSGQSSVPEFLAELDASSDTDRKPPGFEAGAAEAELDMLLVSFNETSFLDLHGSEEKTRYTSHMSLGRKTAGSIGRSSAESLSPRPPKRAPDVNRSALSIDLDDTLDDLLKETSSLISQNVASQSHEVKATPSDFLSSPALPNSKANVLDDFDSWLDTI